MEQSEWDGEEEGSAECECPEEEGSQGTQHSQAQVFYVCLLGWR